MKTRSIIRIIFNLALLAGTIFLIGRVLTHNKKKNEERTALASQVASEAAVRIHNAEIKNLNLNFTTNGNFKPYREMDFASENPGRVVDILVKEGSRVAPGQTLAVIDAGLLSIDLGNAQAALENALRDQERFENAFKTGGVTQQQLDQVRLSVKNAQAMVDQASIRTDDANVRASIGGIINQKYVETGAYVNPGTPLFEIVDISRLKLIVNVNEYQVIQLKVGDEVRVTASVYPDREFKGRITFIGHKADSALNFPVEIEVRNPNNELKAGMYGTAYFDFGEGAPAIVIPRNAFAGSVGSNEIFVVKDGSAFKREVKTGRVIGEEVEIIEGLEEGEKIVTSGQINLTEGRKVIPIQ